MNKQRLSRWAVPAVLLACAFASNLVLGAEPVFQRVHSFSGVLPAEGFGPQALLASSDGNLYGVTDRGGPGNGGTIFCITADRETRVTLHEFGTNAAMGRNPVSLVQASDGRFYGRASGTNVHGLIFRIDASGSNYTVLRQNTNAVAGLFEGSDGRLYMGGSTVARMDADGANFTVLTHETADEIFEGQDGLLYFTAIAAHSIVKIAKDGSNRTLVFQDFPPDGLGNRIEEPSLIRQGFDGRLYGIGTDASGGPGFLFRVETNANNSTSAFAQERNSIASRLNSPSGFFQSTNGLFYLVNSSGSTNNRGSLTAVATTLMATQLIAWPTTTAGEFGARTIERVVEAPDGVLYGISDYGGNQFAGLLFSVNRDALTFTNLLHFSPTGRSDGTNAAPPLVLATNGVLYGTTRNGGAGNRGVIYRINSDGSGYSVLRDFVNDAEGIDPAGGVVEGHDGFLYGATVAGGSQGLGTVYKLRHDGSEFAVMYNIRTNRPAATPRDPSFCAGSLLSHSNGWLYGVGLLGGSAGRGGIFAARKDGSLFTNIHNFIVGEARRPLAGLIEGVDGILYGVTENGGANDAGVFYRLNKDGSGFQILRAFGGGTDGVNPSAPLWQDTNGILFGTTFGGGSNGFGAAFKVNPDGTGYQIIHHFGAPADGRRPTSALVPGPNGMLLGTTRFGGNGPLGNQLGAVFQMSKDGSVYQVLRSFTATNGDGGGLFTKLTEAGNGSYFVPTSFGGDLGFGTVYRLTFASTPPPTITSGPLGVITRPGDVVTLQVEASGTPPLSYQWFFNGTALSGATNVALTITNDAASAGGYSVRVTDANGETNSPTASVTQFNIAPDGSLHLHGATGVLHRVEYVDALGTSPQAWQTLTNVTLPSGPLQIVDPSRPPDMRFYRATLP